MLPLLPKLPIVGHVAALSSCLDITGQLWTRNKYALALVRMVLCSPWSPLVRNNGRCPWCPDKKYHNTSGQPLGNFWAMFSNLWATLGNLWATLGKSGQPLGNLWAISGQVWASLGHSGQPLDSLWATSGQPLGNSGRTLGESGSFWATLDKKWCSKK